MRTLSEQDIIEHLDQMINYFFITRDKTILNGQVEILKSMLQNIQKIKNGHIANQDENNANKWLSIEYLGSSIKHGLLMFISLKENDPESAWNSLVSAQNYVNYCNSAYQLQNTRIQRRYANYFYMIENILFPPQEFLSPEMIIVESICTICERQITTCDHIRGEAYMGKMCFEKHTKIAKVCEISIVDVPADKRCRITHNYDETIRINTMTLARSQK